MLQQNPNLTLDQVKARLMKTVSNGNGTVASSSVVWGSSVVWDHPWFGAAAPRQDSGSSGVRPLTQQVGWSGALRRIPTGIFRDRPRAITTFAACVSREIPPKLQ
jgi:hypothetical protein